MNPLSPLTYYRRHKRSALLLMALICLATLGLYVMVAVLDSIPMRAQYIYLTRVSRIYPAGGDTLEPGVVSQIEMHPDVAHVILDNGLHVSPPTLIGLDNLRLMGVSQGDAQILMAHFGVRLKEGRMFEPRTNQIVISEEVARALGLTIGDRIDRSTNERYYSSVSAPLELVGILERDPALNPGPSLRVGFASQEYLSGHESFAPRTANLLVVAREGRKAAVDEFLESTIASKRTEIQTYREIFQLVSRGLKGLHVLLGAVNLLVAIVVALAVGVINRIALTRRLAEFGLLYAVGFHKRQLIGRLTLETAALAGTGWIFGLALAQLTLACLQASLYYARGMELDLANLTPLWFVVPIPIVVAAFTALSAIRIFARFDAVAIIQRGNLDMEAEGGQRKVRRSSIRPLSPWTFYLRHRRRGSLLVVSIAFMILGVAFPGFLTSVALNAMQPSFGYLRYVSTVSPGAGHQVDAGVTAQIKRHPAAAGVIHAMPLALAVRVPPGGTRTVAIYGIAENELPALLRQLGMHLVAGRLPRARSNEILLSEAVALNRGLRVGDTLGRSAQAGDEADPLITDDIPIEMVVVGLLSPEDRWLGFASLEYLESHELSASRPVHLLTLPAEGRKGELDAWLYQNVASAQTEVTTYASAYAEHRRELRGLIKLFAAVESIIAFVAATALAALNHIFFVQRREEFGVLYAVGRSRSWLLLRTARETIGVVTIAWLIGAVVCTLGLSYAQAQIYAPMGLRLNLLNLSPWLFTLPIPLVVVAASVGTIGRLLSRLDPVSIVERR